MLLRTVLRGVTCSRSASYCSSLIRHGTVWKSWRFRVNRKSSLLRVNQVLKAHLPQTTSTSFLQVTTSSFSLSVPILFSTSCSTSSPPSRIVMPRASGGRFVSIASTINSPSLLIGRRLTINTSRVLVPLLRSALPRWITNTTSYPLSSHSVRAEGMGGRNRRTGCFNDLVVPRCRSSHSIAGART